MAVELNYELKKFDMKLLDRPCTCLFTGQRATGKTVLIRDALYHKRGIISSGIVIGRRYIREYNEYGNIIPKDNLYSKYDRRIIKECIIDKQDKSIKENGVDKLKPLFLVMDECRPEFKDNEMQYMFFNNRMIKTYVFLSQQYPVGVPPAIRENIDFVFILRTSIIHTRRRIYETYASFFPSFEVFCNVMDQCTGDYNCLVIHYNSQNDNIEDKVFWYKADIHSDDEFNKYKVGSLKQIAGNYVKQNDISYKEENIPRDVKEYLDGNVLGMRFT